MEDQHANAKRSANARLEHIDVPDGEGYIRWYTFNRGSEASGLGASHDANSGGADQALDGRLRRTLDLVKSTLLFWR